MYLSLIAPLQTIFSNVFERVIYIPLVEYLTDNSLLDSKQSANRKLHSAETALLRTINDYLPILDSSKLVLMFSLDLFVAFDTLHHKNLG